MDINPSEEPETPFLRTDRFRSLHENLSLANYGFTRFYNPDSITRLGSVWSHDVERHIKVTDRPDLQGKYYRSTGNDSKEFYYVLYPASLDLVELPLQSGNYTPKTWSRMTVAKEDLPCKIRNQDSPWRYMQMNLVLVNLNEDLWTEWRMQSQKKHYRLNENHSCMLLAEGEGEYKVLFERNDFAEEANTHWFTICAYISAN